MHNTEGDRAWIADVTKAGSTQGSSSSHEVTTKPGFVTGGEEGGREQCVGAERMGGRCSGDDDTMEVESTRVEGMGRQCMEEESVDGGGGGGGGGGGEYKRSLLAPSPLQQKQQHSLQHTRVPPQVHPLSPSQVMQRDSAVILQHGLSCNPSCSTQSFQFNGHMQQINGNSPQFNSLSQQVIGNSSNHSRTINNQCCNHNHFPQTIINNSNNQPHNLIQNHSNQRFQTSNLPVVPVPHPSHSQCNWNLNHSPNSSSSHFQSSTRNTSHQHHHPQPLPSQSAPCSCCSLHHFTPNHHLQYPQQQNTHHSQNQFQSLSSSSHQSSNNLYVPSNTQRHHHQSIPSENTNYNNFQPQQNPVNSSHQPPQVPSLVHPPQGPLPSNSNSNNTSETNTSTFHQHRQQEQQYPKNPELEALEREKRALEARLDEAQGRRRCVVCMDAFFGAVFVPCLHLVACPSCAVTLSACPVCRTKIQYLMPVSLD